MACTLITPSPPLQQFIRHYWQCAPRAQACPQFEVPSPFPTLVFRHDRLGHQLPAHHAATPVVSQWALRPVSHLRRPLPGGPAESLFGIAFQPAGFYQLFGVSMAAAGSAGPEPLGPAGHFVRALAHALRGAGTAGQCMAATEQLLLAQQGRGRRGALPLGLYEGVAHILQRHGQVNIGELASQANLCRRQFDRRFREVVGVAPKLFAEISRFHHAVRQLDAEPSPSWQDITHACGYFDQAHFNREFRRFASAAPTAYRQQAQIPLPAAEP